jgi:hypothetical protein
MSVIVFCRKAIPWLLLACIVIWTLGPVGDRPGIGHPQLERFAAYFCLGALLVAGHPRRWLFTAAFVSALAIGLELAQLFIPGRDAGVHDAVAKVLGGLAGVFLTVSITRLMQDTPGPAQSS